jgi:hypothetical protein
MSGVQNNSKYSRGLLGPSKSTFMPGLPVNGRGHSAPEFVHTSGCMLLLLLTFSASSELTLCSPPENFHIYFTINTIFTL